MDVAQFTSLLSEFEIDRVLFEANGPRVFTCTTRTGPAFLAVAVAETEDGETFLFVEADTTLPGDLERGLKLRDAVLGAPGGMAYVVEMRTGDEPAVRTLPITELPAEWLPPPSLGLTLLTGL